ncbi:hypothetical protein [Malonomonas rubra]|uniref:hypothetical protein n=1 Tax=Malonomonas rubra TaxID=57040 RepID=UPI0026EE3B5A|nr:hypothetical protein [Malonomonas rubra]
MRYLTLLCLALLLPSWPLPSVAAEESQTTEKPPTTVTVEKATAPEEDALIAELELLELLGLLENMNALASMEDNE